MPASDSLYRLPADYVTGRREKPRRMYSNAARGNDRERCGPQARFWEARSYPAWVWMIGVFGAGLTIIVAYMAFYIGVYLLLPDRLLNSVERWSALPRNLAALLTGLADHRCSRRPTAAPRSTSAAAI